MRDIRPEEYIWEVTMQITRRRLLSAGATVLAAQGLLRPTSLWAATELAVEGRSIITLSDGMLMLPREMVVGDLADAQVTSILNEYGLTGDTFTPACNLTLLRDGDRTMLFDVGSGPDFMPSAGKLAEAMDAAGIDPSDVTDVVFTHGHPDHLWGLLDDFDEPVFPDAAYHMGRVEWDYWMDPATVENIDAGRQAFAVGASRRLPLIEGRVTLFDDGTEVLPGIVARATFGHTPGHMAFEVGMGSDAAMVVGDAIVNHHLAFELPEAQAASDQDPERGAVTRVELLNELASRQIAFVGFHLPEGGIGHVAREGDHFRFVPA